MFINHKRMNVTNAELALPVIDPRDRRDALSASLRDQFKCRARHVEFQPVTTPSATDLNRISDISTDEPTREACDTSDLTSLEIRRIASGDCQDVLMG
jgi:hypothetical protein